jgi:hypothetical protein
VSGIRSGRKKKRVLLLADRRNPTIEPKNEKAAGRLAAANAHQEVEPGEPPATCGVTITVMVMLILYGLAQSGRFSGDDYACANCSSAPAF